MHKPIMKLIIFSFMLSISFSLMAQNKYFGAQSTEAMLEFEGHIEYEVARSLTIDQLNGTTAKAKEVQAAVEYQLSFLIGHLQSESFIKDYHHPGVLSDQQTFKFTRVSDRTNGKQLITYHYTGKTNFHSKLFSRSETAEVPLNLPLNPLTIYAKGIVGGKNRCTDEHYDSEDDFFYFWDIGKTGCPLKKDTVNILRLTGKLKRLPNTTSTYPEFNRLYKTEILNVAAFIGYIEGVTPGRVRTSDSGYQTYKGVHEEILGLGFKITEEKKRFNGNNYLTRFEKSIVNQLGYQQKVVVHLLLSGAEPSSKDKTFETYFKSALENSQLIAYDGHSGLGWNLDLDRFDGVKLRPFYQIFYLNGCSSYPYFNSMYFTAKPGGKKNLEIITAGLPTYTSTSMDNMMVFLKPFLNGRFISYQTLMTNMERSNGDAGTYLMGVNGDEDNQFRP